MSGPATSLIDAVALARLVDGGDLVLFDCRFVLADPGAGRAAYEAGHLPGAHYTDLELDLSGSPDGRNGRHPLPDRARLASWLGAHGLAHGVRAVAYDDAGGAFAARLWWLLRWLGHSAVAVLDGGIQAWTAAGLPLEAGPGHPTEARPFVASPEAGMATIAAEALLAGLERGDRLIVDARAPARFHGEPHPLDPVAGHIPGAANRFFGDNLGPDGRFKPAERLRAEYRALAGDRPSHELAFYCGSGVTAAHDLLAMSVAGLDGAAVYPGSWSEWIADPARPVAR